MTYIGHSPKERFSEVTGHEVKVLMSARVILMKYKLFDHHHITAITRVIDLILQEKGEESNGR